MPTLTLENLVGETLDQRFRIAQLLRNEPERALFRATEEFDGTSPREMIIIVDLSEFPDDHFKRFLESKFLKHPNLAPALSVGWLEIEGRRHPWMASELPESILGDMLHHDTSLETSELIGIVRQVISGLAYLHSENIAYCALRAETVWHVNDQWVLSDFSQLRVMGSEPPGEADLSPYARETLPPEATASEVDPAWDVWSLGPLVTRALQTSAGRSRKRGESALGDPQLGEALIHGVTATTAQSRPSLSHVTHILKTLQTIQPARELTLSVPREDLTPEAKPVFPRLRSRTEIAARPAARPDELDAKEKLPWMRILQAAVVIIVAFLAALFLGRAMTHSAGVSSVKPTGAAVNGESHPVPAQPQSLLPASSQTQSKLTSAPGNDAAAPPAIRSAIVTVLDNWVGATKASNPVALVDCYAPVVDTYYSRHNITSYQLEKEKERSLEAIGPINVFAISDLRYNLVTPDSVVVTFLKTWSFGGRKPFSGAAREQMILRPFSDHWKISSEREIRVF